MFRRYSQKCENIFRVARSMSGTFSSSVNFAVYQFLRRDRKLSVLQDIERPCELDETNYSLQFSKDVIKDIMKWFRNLSMP